MHAGRHLAGLFTSLLCLLGGLWLLLGAWVLGLVPRSGPWPAAAVLNVASGAGVTLAALVALLLYGRTLAADLRERSGASLDAPDHLPPRRRRNRRATGPGPAPASRSQAPDHPRDDVEELLLPIASAVLSDVVRQRGGALKAPGGEGAPR